MNSVHFTPLGICKLWAAHIHANSICRASSRLTSWNKATWPLSPMTFPIYECYRGTLSLVWREHGFWWCIEENVSEMLEPRIITTYMMLCPSAGIVFFSVQHVFIIHISRVACVCLWSTFMTTVNAQDPCSEGNVDTGSGSCGKLMWTQDEVHSSSMWADRWNK